jgi:hypothetical protein
MSTVTPVVQEFFNQYASGRTVMNVDAIGSQYHETFMQAGPGGVRVADKTAILAAFSKGQEFLMALGHESTEVLSLDETRLDEHYALVRARFVWRFRKAPAPHIDVNVDSSFILRLSSGAPAIVFQHEHEEFQQLLRASGVLGAPK